MRAVSSCHAAAVCSPIFYRRNPSLLPTCSVSVSTAKHEIDDEISSVAPHNRRRLILLRHAESALPDKFLRDHVRPLSKSGRVDAISISRELRRMGWIPELILSSDAIRTKETLKIMQEYSKEFSQAEVHFMPSFYSIAAMDGQTAEHLQKVVCQYSTDEILTVMCMGHNRGWEEAASMFSGSSIELKTCNAALLEASGESWNEVFGRASQEPGHTSEARKYNRHPQNVDLPPVLLKKKKKPFPIPIHKVQRAARIDRKLAHMGVEKHLEPPKNGLLVPGLIPVAYQTLESWKVLIEGLAQLLTLIPVYGCRECLEVHVGPTGHLIQDCSGPQNVKRRSRHMWVRGTINDVLIPIESYHIFDPFGHRIKHETRFNYERIPAVVELCIQAGVELPQYPSRRRSIPVRMLGKKVIDRGGFAEEPKPCRSQDAMALLSEIDTYAVLKGQSISPPADTRKVAERTLKAYSTVRSGVRQLMRKYTVKACGYCSEVHVGPWGHNAKLCGAFKHQWRDGKHGWQDATIDEMIPPNFVWHLKDPKGPLPTGALKKFYGKAPAVVEVCVQGGAEIPDAYRPMMRLDIVIPDTEEARLVA